MSRRRWWSWLTAGLSLAGATFALIPARSHLALQSILLLMLLVVVLISTFGGIVVGLSCSLAAVLLVNYYFVDPLHTLRVEGSNNDVALLVFAAVAAVVSVTFDLATRRRVVAERSRREAEIMASLAAVPASATSLATVLEQLASTFSMTTVEILERGRVIERLGPSPSIPPAIREPVGDDIELLAYGTPLFAPDRRVVTGLARAAARALEDQRTAHEAARSVELDAIDKVRAALLAAVGHDLRNPLASIKASVSSLRQSDIIWAPDEQAELLAGIEDSADRLDDLVGNLLAMSRLQAGVLSVTKQPVAVDQVVAKAILHSGGSIQVDVADDLEVDTDAGLLERVIANLCANAVSHGGDPVTVRASRCTGQVTIAVIDHGRGVQAGDLDKIFSPFQRLDDRTSHGGIGLGLAIARGFTEALGGRLTASPTPGGGLTMAVSLP